MINEITVQELKALKSENKDFQLIDVREEHEADEFNIGGELIPLGTVPEHTDKIATDKTVVIHCRSGKRSANAIQYLQGQGFDNLVNLEGGVLAWQAEYGDEKFL